MQDLRFLETFENMESFGIAKDFNDLERPRIDPAGFLIRSIGKQAKWNEISEKKDEGPFWIWFWTPF